MISIDDIIGLTGLRRDEVDAIAEHEHIPEAAAAAMASYLLHEDKGPHVILGMIRDDLQTAVRHGNESHARELLMALRHFVHEHPEVADQ